MAKILLMLQFNVPIVFTAKDKKPQVYVLSLENTIGFIVHELIKVELEIMVKNRFPKYKIRPFEYSYNFRQHEWACLFGKSGRPRVLIIEDEPSIRKATLIKLDQADEYELYSADNGMDGLLKALLIKPDIILSDIVMPVMDGLAMSQLFFILNKPYPIVFLSAKINDKVKKKAKTIDGVIGLLHKKIMQNREKFLLELKNQLEAARKMKSRLAETYQDGKMETLAKGDKEDGVFKFGSSEHMTQKLPKGSLGKAYRPTS
jgi:CheY-like chemotaxis protein